MKETTVSQIPDCSHSLSLPSEPPDITNWFPSYKYESFVLDTYDGVGGSQFREGETERCGSPLVGGIGKENEGLLDDSGRNGHNNDDKFEAKTCNKMLDSLYSASILSEPPHIKNWFSSYEYQSPMSDEENLKVSATQESDSCKDESPMKGRQSEKVENFVELSNSGRSNKEGKVEELLPYKYLLKDSLGEVAYEKPCCMIPDSSELSALSGPPDVGNWFPSYVYESPDMDENSELVIGETEFEEDQFANRRTKKEKEMEFQKLGQSGSAEKEALDLTVPSDVDLEFDSHSHDDNLDSEFEDNEVLGKEKFSSQDILGGQRVHCQNDACANPNTNLVKDREIFRLSDERPQLEQKQTHKFPAKCFVSLKTELKLSSRDDESPSKLIYKQNQNMEPNPENESTFISSRNNDRHIQVAVASTKKTTHKFNSKENGQQECLSHGFVSTKKKRIVLSIDENSLGQAEIMLPCSKNKRSSLEGDEDKNGGVRRKVLSERTNFGQTAGAMEVTGKWKCPQKRKPFIGPPLKQLRLEQWVLRRQ